jgi:lysophospholipase L1-like esterase/pimeloyl-ACP methyl ester carboxylesterase
MHPLSRDFVKKCLIALFITVICGCAVAAESASKNSPPEGAKSEKILVACVGDSISAGYGTDYKSWEAYPAQLQRLLGDDYVVVNFGVSGRTAINGNASYQILPQFKSVLEWSPDIVVLQLGTNDTNPKIFNQEQFAADYSDMVGKFQAMRSKPRIYLSLPPFIHNPADESALQQLLPIIQDVAKTAQANVIDVHSAFINRRDLMPDGLHPNSAGASLLAKTVYKAITGLPAGEVPDRVISQWNGYNRLDFVSNGRPAILVSPKTPAPGRPWIWRTEFFDASPSVDIALLAKGWHVAYVNVSNLFGAPAALNAMDGFHAQLTKQNQLSNQPVLEGFSRGGLYAFNWAARNPAKVRALYVDAPVCDFKSWPAGKGKGIASLGEWSACLNAYGFAEEQALAYPLNPIDNLAPLAVAKIPIIAVAGDADKTVPVDENILVVETRYKKLGGQIKVILKPGADHHPHSLTDPTLLVDFLLQQAAPAP